MPPSPLDGAGPAVSASRSVAIPAPAPVVSWEGWPEAARVLGESIASALRAVGIAPPTVAVHVDAHPLLGEVAVRVEVARETAPPEAVARRDRSPRTRRPIAGPDAA